MPVLVAVRFILRSPSASRQFLCGRTVPLIVKFGRGSLTHVSPPGPFSFAGPRWYVDGVLFCDRQYWYSRPGPGEEDFPFPAPFDTGFYLIMNVAVGGSFTGGPIDKVRVGRAAGGGVYWVGGIRATHSR